MKPLGRPLVRAGLSVVFLGYVALSAWAQEAHARSLLAQSGTNSLVCNEIRQKYVTGQLQLNARTLNFLFFDAAERGCLALVQELLDRGASIRARDRFGNTGLLLAARTGEREVVRSLIGLGADINHQNLAGSTALLRAVTMNRRRTAKILIEAGADPDLPNNRGITPLIAAAFNGNTRLVKLLLEAGVDTSVRDATGKAAMVYAAGRGYAGIVEMLLKAGTDVNTRYGHDLTALMWAAGHTNDVPVAEGLQTVTLLLDYGARVDLVDDRGRTALMTAAERGHAEIVSLLLARGSNPQVQDKWGQTARDLAMEAAVRRALEGKPVDGGSTDGP